MNFENGVARVPFPGQQEFDPQLMDRRLEPAQFGVELAGQGGILTLLGQFQQGAQVLLLPFDLGPAAEFALKGGFLAADARRSLGVFPEVRLRGRLFQFLELSGQVREVKDAPEVR